MFSKRFQKRKAEYIYVSILIVVSNIVKQCFKNHDHYGHHLGPTNVS